MSNFQLCTKLLYISFKFKYIYLETTQKQVVTWNIHALSVQAKTQSKLVREQSIILYFMKIQLTFNLKTQVISSSTAFINISYLST